jgi:NDP-hexose C3-ketoreductase / dTDP-4-oxo-2-deoxy-alpha-D-pentos-2-ene 2,3-reductase
LPVSHYSFLSQFVVNLVFQTPITERIIMQYTNLGRTGLKVSRLCLGTMNFGTQTTPEASFAIMDRALATGVNFFDTANRYGRDVRLGYTEEIIGNWRAA